MILKREKNGHESNFRIKKIISFYFYSFDERWTITVFALCMSCHHFEASHSLIFFLRCRPFQRKVFSFRLVSSPIFAPILPFFRSFVLSFDLSPFDSILLCLCSFSSNVLIFAHRNAAFEWWKERRIQMPKRLLVKENHQLETHWTFFFAFNIIIINLRFFFSCSSLFVRLFSLVFAIYKEEKLQTEDTHKKSATKRQSLAKNVLSRK